MHASAVNLLQQLFFHRGITGVTGICRIISTFILIVSVKEESKKKIYIIPVWFEKKMERTTTRAFITKMMAAASVGVLIPLGS